MNMDTFEYGGWIWKQRRSNEVSFVKSNDYIGKWMLQFYGSNIKEACWEFFGKVSELFDKGLLGTCIKTNGSVVIVYTEDRLH